MTIATIAGMIRLTEQLGIFVRVNSSQMFVGRRRFVVYVTLTGWVAEEATTDAKKACFPSSRPCFRISSRCSAVMASTVVFLDLGSDFFFHFPVMLRPLSG